MEQHSPTCSQRFALFAQKNENKNNGGGGGGARIKNSNNRTSLRGIGRSVSLPVYATAQFIQANQQLEEQIADSVILDQDESEKFLYKALKIVTESGKRKLVNEVNNLAQLLGGHPLCLRLATGYIRGGNFLPIVIDEGEEHVRERIVEFLDIFKPSTFSTNHTIFYSLSKKEKLDGEKENGKENENFFWDWTTFNSIAKCPVEEELVHFIAGGVLRNWLLDKNMAGNLSSDQKEKLTNFVTAHQQNFLQSKTTKIKFRYTNQTAKWMFQIACALRSNDTDLVHNIILTVRTRMDIEDEFDWFNYLHQIAFASLWPRPRMDSTDDSTINRRYRKLFLENELGFPILKNIFIRVEKSSRKISTVSTTLEDKYLDWIISLIGHGKDSDCVELVLGNEELMAAFRRTFLWVKNSAEANQGVKELETLHKILLIWFALYTGNDDGDDNDEGAVLKKSHQPLNSVLFEGMGLALRAYHLTAKRYKGTTRDTENLQRIWPAVADKCHILVRFMSVHNSKESSVAVELCKGILKMIDEGYLA